MARYQLRRPSPIRVPATRAKRQEAGIGAVGPGSEEEGPESPDSPGSSPSTIGAPSPGDTSDSDEDEPPSPQQSSTSSSNQVTATSTTTSSPPSLSSTSSASPTSTTSIQPSSQTSSTTSTTSSTTSTTSTSSISSSSRQTSSSSTSTSSPAFTQTPTSRGIGAIAPPQQVTNTSTTAVTSTRSTSTTSSASPISPTFTSQIFSSRIARPTQPVTSAISTLPPPPDFTGSPVSDNDPPRRTRPEPTLMSKGAEAAAITLSIIGAIALVVGILFYCRRRKRRQNEKLEAELERDAANYAALRAPETAHINDSIAPFASNVPHMTQSSDRSNTLFGPGSYSRPETVSTRDGSRIHRTPNPFADPPLNKAYDVLAGRPRSTTLTDRGSWIKNPFKDPESERFDPFGELQARARRERVKQVELARKEAELERQFAEKEKMGLMPPEMAMGRKGSGVTLEGMGVLDRSTGGAYK